ncbi:hypothetical protein NDN08_003207 [Rhodosorus marinus]|uniref:Cytochrome b5 heme-binding domain-containing protein n=1 Tax=Rhodosorus marinus TaxID=101924 RepID=A0AAV8UYK1_9RHOD|nr:hypothetical protein NDN08_003207 [Rhodosorus marinus]
MDEDGKEKKSLTLFQVSKHKSDDDLYVAVHDRVYDLSGFWRRHPGGEGLIRERAAGSFDWLLYRRTPWDGFLSSLRSKKTSRVCGTSVGPALLLLKTVPRSRARRGSQ